MHGLGFSRITHGTGFGWDHLFSLGIGVSLRSVMDIAAEEGVSFGVWPA